MTPSELKRAIADLGWSRSHFGELVDTHRNTVNRWMNAGPVPGPVAAFVRLAQKVNGLAAALDP